MPRRGHMRGPTWSKLDTRQRKKSISWAVYGGVIVNATGFAKEHFRPASAMAGRVGRMSRHRTVMPRVTKKIRSDFIEGVVLQLHGRAPTWPSTWSPPSRCMMD